MHVKSRNAVVLGLGLTGLSLVRWLVRHGANVRVADTRESPPNAAILAVGAMSAKPVVRDNEIVIRQMMRVTMSCDHRVIDGATGAKFLQTFKKILENPLYLVV